MEGMVLDALKLKVSHVSWLDDLTIKLFFLHLLLCSLATFGGKKKKVKKHCPMLFIWGVLSEYLYSKCGPLRARR